MATQSFRELEQVGWSRKAAQYDDYLARITGQAIDPILDTLDVKKGLVLLDVCCGTGALTYAAARRGCAATGIDFATEMVAQASRNYPGLAFREGDATALDFEDASFDVVACSFGILHFDEPERAIDETLRVLRPRALWLHRLVTEWGLYCIGHDRNKDLWSVRRTTAARAGDFPIR